MTSLHLSTTLALPLPLPGTMDRWIRVMSAGRRRRRSSGPRHLAAMHRLIARRARGRGDLMAAEHYLACSRALRAAAATASR